MKPKLFLIFILGTMLLLPGRPQAVAAEDLPVVSFDPDLLEADPGETKTVDVRIENVENLWAFSLLIYYDPQVIQVEAINPGGFLSTKSGEYLISVSLINNDMGLIQFDMTQKRVSDDVPQPANGSGPLLEIRFSANHHPGMTVINLAQVILSDRNGVPILGGLDDGDVRVLGSLPDSYGTPSNVPLVVSPGEGVLVNDYLPAGKKVTAILIDSPPAGEGLLEWPSLKDGGFVYDPKGWSGNTSFTYRACVEGGSCYDPVDVTIQVEKANLDKLIFLPMFASP